MPKGYLALVLHAHLPFVRHPECDYFLEEKWLFEAITECYIPLIHVLERLLADNVQFRLTISLSPPLVNMLRDQFLQDRYTRHLELLRELAEKEVFRTRDDPNFHPVAKMYQNLLEQAWYTYIHRYGRDLTRAFKTFQDAGRVELITCGATHGYFPLLGIHPETIYAQVGIAVNYHHQVFGLKPRGFWLPECGYQPGHDWILQEYGIRYFFTDTHGIMNAETRPKYGVYAPIYCPSGVAAFGRDPETSKQVWSSNEGYPGDFDYREFYRDIGYDLPLDYIGPYVQPNGERTHTGFKYYRITGKTDHKEPYVPEWAFKKAEIHAGNFMFNREKQIEFLADLMDRPPLVVSPYDAELFGHWWFEGPWWLETLIRKVSREQNTFQLVTPGDYLEMFPVNQVTTPSTSSWGYKGYHEVWLEGSNDWIYPHLHKAAERMIELADRFPKAEGILARALNQAARELLLAQSSDWAFIMKTGTMVAYAIKRTKDHLARFTKLYEDILGNKIEEWWLIDVENKDNIFPDIDYRIFRSRQGISMAAG